jgi:hypothetical protein
MRGIVRPPAVEIADHRHRILREKPRKMRARDTRRHGGLYKKSAAASAVAASRSARTIPRARPARTETARPAFITMRPGRPRKRFAGPRLRREPGGVIDAMITPLPEKSSRESRRHAHTIRAPIRLDGGDGGREDRHHHH